MSVESMPTGAVRARAARQARVRRITAVLVCFTGLPTLLAILYYGTWASDQYLSVSAFKVESADDGGIAGMTSLLGALPVSGAGTDALVVRDYILSRDMMAHLSAEHGWQEHVADTSLDWWSRLAKGSGSEAVYEDYLNRVNVIHDSQSNLLTLEVRAYSAAKARAMAEAVLSASEGMVNQISERLRSDQIQFAQAEVDKAEARFAKARENVLTLQTEGAEFDPAASAAALMQVRTGLEVELAKLRAERDALAKDMRPDAPKMRALNQRVQSLAAQVAAQRRRLVQSGKSSGSSDARAPGLNHKIAKFERALIEKEFAQQALQSAVTSLEMARVEATRQHRYLVTIARPSEPDMPTHPRRAWGIFTVFILSLIATGIGTIVVAAIREHARL